VPEIIGSEPMIMTLRVTTEWGLYVEEVCMREIEIASDDTLMGLHYAIQDAVDFDCDHMFEFFYGRHPRNRKVVFESEDQMLDFENPLEFYETIPLATVWPVPAKGVQLFYHFDFGDNWYFKVRKMSRKDKTPNPKVQYPRVIKKERPNPKQYPDFDEQW